MSKPKVLLLSGYDASSHCYWRKLLESKLPEFQWTQISLPDRYFSWRIRGNSLSFAFQQKEILEQDYDCLIVTSMVDLSALRGFVPRLAKIPTLVYFHENQFDYPLKKHQMESEAKQQAYQNSISAQLTSIYTILCADKVLFNSQYNQTTFFDGANKLLNKLPDEVPKEILVEAEKWSEVCPVPITDEYYNVVNSRKNLHQQNQETEIKTSKNNHIHDLQSHKIIEFVWNHRWEYDKQPEVLFDALRLLKKKAIPFKLHLLGQSFRKSPACFEQAKEEFKFEISTWGFQTKQKYHEILNQADVVISTAIHDFQGLSMLEAIASGCYPVAPNRVVYPEYLADENCYLNDSSCNEAESLMNHLVKVCEFFDNNILDCHQSMALVKCYSEGVLIPKYQLIINELINV